MADEDRTGEAGEEGGPRAPEGQAGDILNEAEPPGEELVLPGQSPLFHAEHAQRYERQELIGLYEHHFECRLVVVIDSIFGPSITLFEELVYDADPTTDMHLLLSSPGGDGETAVRLVRSAQARCRELTIIVPDQAKSAATLLAMGAHRILMGPSSDLGPVDPQFPVGRRGELVSAKDIIAAVTEAEEAISARPDTYPLHASLLSDVSALMVQQARSALARTDDLMKEALKSNTDRSEGAAEDLFHRLREPLVELPRDHGAVFGARDALRAGLPVEEADPRSDQWKLIWRLWAKYVLLDCYVYEGVRASRTIPRHFIPDFEG